MFSIMKVEAQTDVEDKLIQLTPDERIQNVQRLMNKFVNVLQPKLDKMTIHRCSGARNLDWDRFNTQIARDAANAFGEVGEPPIAVLERGSFTFTLINYVNEPEIRALAMSVKDGQNPLELVALVHERYLGGHLHDGLIEYRKDSSKAINTVAAVKGVESVWKRLKHPLLSSLPLIFKRTA